MPTINFPTSPSLNDTYTFEGKTWTWNGISWIISSTPTTIRLDSAYTHANAAYAAANLAVSGTVDVYARDHANAAFDKANTGATPVSGIFDYGLVTEVTSYVAYDYGTL